MAGLLSQRDSIGRAVLLLGFTVHVNRGMNNPG